MTAPAPCEARNTNATTMKYLPVLIWLGVSAR